MFLVTMSGQFSHCDDLCDVLVVGGGINGAGIARDLAGRGVSVLLCEQHDLAAHTSSASTKLIHGGLRYLEHYEFGLVRKSLLEREVLMRAAPHLIHPLRFVMPHDPAMRPAWMIRAGIFLYDHLARREVLPGSDVVDLRRDPMGDPLHERFVRGFAYSDGWVDDARLVVLTVRDAADRGARVLTRTRVVRAVARDDRWQVVLREEGGSERAVCARALVNVTGPWADRFLHEAIDRPRARPLRLVKGSHIVVPRMFDHPNAYIFQNADKRIVFAIPFEQRFTLIGTTDVEFEGDPASARIEDDEVSYLCELIRHYFKRPVTPADVVWSYSGVRPLLEDESGDPAAVTRDFEIDFEESPARLMSVWGGKITTYRVLAQGAAGRIARSLGVDAPDWTEHCPLPGGDLRGFIGEPDRPDIDFAHFIDAVLGRWPGLPPTMLRRMARHYGADIEQVLGGARQPADLGERLAADLYEAELRHLREREWARDAEDVLWRRTKLGLVLDTAERQRTAQWFATA